MTHHTSFLFRVAEDLKIRFGDQIGNIAVVFNNKRPTVFLKKYLAEVYGRTMISPEMLTVQEFMTLSTERAIAHDISRFFMLLDSYNHLLADEQKEPVSPDFFYPMSQTLLADFDQLDYELVNPETLYSQLKDLGEIRQQFHEFTKEQQAFIKHFWASFSAERQSDIQQKFIELWQRLPRLYRRFDRQLAEKRLTGIAKVYRHLAEGHADNPDFINAYQCVAFVGFNALNRCEAKLFRRWQDDGKAVFYFDGDDYYFKDRMQEAGMFLRRNLKEFGLKNALGDFPERLNRPDKQLMIYPVDGFSAQAKTLFFQLNDQAALQEKTADPEKRAIILADETLLIPTLQSLPENEILNITMGLPIRQSQTFGIINLWLDFQEKINGSTEKQFPFSEKDLWQFTGLGLPGFMNTGAEIFLQKCASVPPEQLGSTVRQYNDGTRIFFSRYPDGGSCIGALQQLMSLHLEDQKNTGRLKNIEANLMLRVYQELNKLQDQLEKYQGALSLPLALRLIRRCLSGLTAPVTGEPLEGLQIMGMLESRCLDFDEVYWLGAHEGALPGHSQQNSFIPESLRQAFGLPLREDKDALSSYLFYRLCQKADRIHVFYNQLVDSNSDGEISRYIRQLAFESRITMSYRLYGFTPGPVEKSNIKASLPKTDEVQQLLNDHFTENGKSFSASALKTFLDCPRQFFARYIARLPETPDTPEPLAPQILGTTLHDVMQELYRPFEKSGAPVSAEDIKAMENGLPQICRESLRKVLTKGIFKACQPDSRWQIAEKIVLENVRLLLRHDKEHVAPFRILGLEKDYQMSVPLVLSENGRTEKVNFFARIDRIDEANGKLRIVDYKTGTDSLEVKDLATLFSSGAKHNPAAFQALFYAFLYYKAHGHIPETHLYILKNIVKGQTRLEFQGEIPEQDKMMTHFEDHLGRLIGRICLLENDFAHNPIGKYCVYSPYAFLCEHEDKSDNEDNDNT
ncbi:MAG TPA: PD-(D/E)XK nuclease family protein [Edaphocola sp.]|nr:PD-(D/E)XK nuclease family protein [Edaphocola sp.]